jgi:hypothetical protein
VYAVAAAAGAASVEPAEISGGAAATRTGRAAVDAFGVLAAAAIVVVDPAAAVNFDGLLRALACGRLLHCVDPVLSQ